MQIILGIDQAERHGSAMRLLSRLRFAHAFGHILHVIEPLMDITLEMGPAISSGALADYMTFRETEARALTMQVGAELEKAGLPSDGAVRVGAAGYEMLAYAQEVNADLIAVGHSGKSEAGAFFTGSVGRALVIGSPRSVLVGKDSEPAREGPVRAVLATDHSDYADRCIDELLRFAPQGIEHVTVLTTYPKADFEGMRPFLQDFVLDPAEGIERSLCDRNYRVMDRLAALGCGRASRVEGLPVDAAIALAMKETNADLLIVGARGHGFVERLEMGSVSFHQVVGTDHPVLVLRAASQPAGRETA